jgi:predicted amidohydrolase YtcJ
MGLALVLGGCEESPQNVETNASARAELVFIGDHIVTMAGDSPSAVAVNGERITRVGSEAEIRQLVGPETRVVELGSRALLPGFIDAHGHFSSLARTADLVDLSPPPVGGAETIDDIVRSLRLYIERQQLPEGEAVGGFGYDDSLLAERRHPTREDLDRASTKHPIVIRHVSGHLAVGNSAALALAGINSETADPDGGIVRRRADGEPDGVMEETAMGLLPDPQSKMTPQRFAQLRRATLDTYAGFGITTIQDSNLPLEYIELLRAEASAEPYPVDVVAYAMANPISDELLDSIVPEAEYESGFRLGGVKFHAGRFSSGPNGLADRALCAGATGSGRRLCCLS